mgnify:CR=1 FL=1
MAKAKSKAEEKTLKEKREEIKEIINDEKEFVEPMEVVEEADDVETTEMEDGDAGVPNPDSVMEAFTEAETAAEDYEQDHPLELKDSDDLKELMDGYDEIENSKEQLNEVLQNGTNEEAEEFVKKELEKANKLKEKADEAAKKRLKKVSFTSFWNGQYYV